MRLRGQKIGLMSMRRPKNRIMRMIGYKKHANEHERTKNQVNEYART
jgi:hypothetical protein